MTWTPPAQKWKLGRNSIPEVCECVMRERFDTLATPRVFTPAGFEVMCPSHFDPDVEVGLMETFQGEFMTFEEWHAWESAWYSWVVWHEIGERTDVDPVEKAEMQAKQEQRSRRVARGIPNLHRASTDDGPWKPTQAIRTPNANHRAAVVRAQGWIHRDDALKELVKAEAPAEFEAGAFWWEGTGGTRTLHVDAAIAVPDRNRIDSRAAIAFGDGPLIVWED